MEWSPQRSETIKIYIHSQGFGLTPAIEAHIHKQLSRKLANNEDHVIAAEVFLSDINGPRGGADKKVLICIQLPSRAVVKIEKVHADLYAAVSIAARQSRRTVKRALRRNERLNKSLLRRLRHFPEDLQAG